MKNLYRTFVGSIGALALAGTVFAQVPSTNDTSDLANNTGMGRNALGGPAATNGGVYNTASGGSALLSNSTGSYNTAFGAYALSSNTASNNNTAAGVSALAGTIGADNTGVGAYVLLVNTSGNYNTAFGDQALRINTTGSNNVAVGYQAGLNLTTGSNNIDIGNVGAPGESNTVRIGTRGTHKATVIAGIFGTPLTGSAVVVTATGRLGVTSSSERYKTAVAPMGSSTAKLGQLRPVTFHLKTEPRGALQYGLIAEEVAKVYPDLVIRNEAGRIEGVRYDELAPMLLNEAQQQAQEIRDLKQQVAIMAEALQKVQAKDELVVQR